VRQRPFSALKSVQAAARNRAFLFGLGLFLFTWAALSIIEAVLLYYVKYVVERENQSGLIMATIFATAMLFLPLWQWASRKLDKRLAYITGVTCLAFALLGMALLNAATSLAVLLALCVLAGSGVTAAHVLT
jgi:glycoside/pentoside/hexuronide:cation symporter, GPH family